MTKTDEPHEVPREIPIRVPIENLSEDAVTGVIQDFILREGTDYGAEEVSLATKVRQVLNQLRNGEAELYFDAAAETITLVHSNKS